MPEINLQNKPLKKYLVCQGPSYTCSSSEKKHAVVSRVMLVLAASEQVSRCGGQKHGSPGKN